MKQSVVELIASCLARITVVEHAVWSRGSDSEIILQQRYCQLMSIVNFREICVRTRPVNPKPLG